MANVVLLAKAYGSVVATMDGMELIVLYHWNKIATTTKTMIKVRLPPYWSHWLNDEINEFATFTDGLVDCEDPECCQSTNCRTSQLCVSAPKPIDVLLRKQPPAITASFFERMKFLIDEGSLQNYAKLETFNER